MPELPPNQMRSKPERRVRLWALAMYVIVTAAIAAPAGDASAQRARDNPRPQAEPLEPGAKRRDAPNPSARTEPKAEPRTGNRKQPSPDDRIDVEATYYRQPALVDAALAKLAPSEPGLSKLYFIGFASFAGQDVFRREIGSVREIMDARFGTAGRSLVLLNHRDTYQTEPLASVSNLERALDGVARLMDNSKDILVLYITTHGTPGQLSVDFPRLQMNDLSAGRLAGMLEKSGIKRRLIIISACYAGSFINRLRSDYAAIMAAARPDRTSFGCSNERQWTYFGDALFNRALRQTYSFTEAFETARGTVGQWEREQKLMPSEPQIDIGPGIAPWLDVLAKRLAQAPRPPAETAEKPDR